MRIQQNSTLKYTMNKYAENANISKGFMGLLCNYFQKFGRSHIDLLEFLLEFIDI